MAKESPLSLTITKLDAARRQIDAAVSLWFQEGDPLAVHMLIAGGHHLCNDMTGKKVSFLWNNSLCPPEHRKALIAYLVRVENFCKHAEKNDPDTVEIDPDFTALYAVDSIELFLHLNGRMTDLMFAFRTRFTFATPHYYKASFTQATQDYAIAGWERLSRAEYLKEFLHLLNRIRGK